jgi:hypothetical protein
MKSSCIVPPANDPLVIIRASFVEICDGDTCAAALLNHLIYWHNVKLDQRHQAIAANEIAERHGERGKYDTALTQWHTEADLRKAMLGAWGKDKIRNGLQTLKDKGFIDIFRNPNSRFAFDKTRHFIVLPEVIQVALDQLNGTTQPKTETAYGKQLSDDGDKETDDGEQKNAAQLYIETTSKITTTGSEAGADAGIEDPFFLGQAKQIAREVAKQTKQPATKNFLVDSPWGELAQELDQDPKVVWEAFDQFMLAVHADKKDPEAYVGKVLSSLFQNPGTELANKHWVQFAKHFRKNLSAPPVAKKVAPRQPQLVEIPDRIASAEAIRRARHG